jgi:hypothetical protein
MKSILAIITLFVGSAAGSASAVSDNELSLGGVALGDSEARVLVVLGQAPKQSDTGEGIALKYPGLTVLVGWLEQQTPDKQRHVLKLTATAPTACTPSGICPGVLVSKAVAAYGQPVQATRDSGSFLEYYSHQSSCWLQLGTSGDTVRSISAVCQP